MATETEIVTVPVQTESSDLDPSLWTTSQELCLLQSLTRWKPVGMHKNFRMIMILDTLWSSGTIPEPIEEHPHVSTAKGVWTKLRSLYDLKALDEREDAILEDPEDVQYWREFELPESEYGAEMWDRRLAKEEEVWSDDGIDTRRRESTVADSDDPRSSPVGSVRGMRASGRRAAGRRLAEVKQDNDGPGNASSRASRRTSKAASSSVNDEEDTIMVDADDDHDGSDEDEEESDAESAEEEGRKQVRITRGRGGRRGGRGRRGRRGK